MLRRCLFVFLFVGGMLALPAMLQAGYERVLVKTADKFGAGTDSNIDLEMWGWLDGKETYSGKVRLNPLISGDAFKQNTTDSVLVPIPSDLGCIYKLKVTSDGKYPGSSWDLESIQVQGRQFNFNTNLDGDSSTRELPKVAPPKVRPVYIVAHECNSVDLVSSVAASGANAIEADFIWDSANGKWVVGHPKDIGHRNPVRTDLTAWLGRVKEVADKQGDALALIYFDIKSKDLKDNKPSDAELTQRIDKLYGEAIAALPNDLPLLFSTGDYVDRTAFDSIIPKLAKNHGVALDYHNNADEVEAYFSGKGAANIWYGNGITSLLPEPGGLNGQLGKATLLRDTKGRIKKVGSWTYERESSIRAQYFDRHLDFVLVEPGAVAITAKMVNGGLVRPARRSDEAFAAFRPQ